MVSLCASKVKFCKIGIKSNLKKGFKLWPLLHMRKTLWRTFCCSTLAKEEMTAFLATAGCWGGCVHCVDATSIDVPWDREKVAPLNQKNLKTHRSGTVKSFFFKPIY